MARAFDLDEVVPWGRNADEYRAFFGLEGLARDTRILDCGGGPASFNAEMTEAGYRVVSADPLYRFSAEAIAARVEETRGVMMASLQQAKARFCWTRFASPAALEAVRLEACRRFLADLPAGRDAGRYLDAALPALPFRADRFDLALSSHFLFLYSDQLDAAFHIAAITEMLRVAGEARIFPLLGLDGAPSPHLEPVRAALDAAGHPTRVQRVGYEFQRGGHSMLRVLRRVG